MYIVMRSSLFQQRQRDMFVHCVGSVVLCREHISARAIGLYPDHGCVHCGRTQRCRETGT